MITQDRLFELRAEFAGIGVHVANAFSINMLSGDCYLAFSKISRDEATFLLEKAHISSHIGHAETAAVASAELGVNIPMVRDTHCFNGMLLVVQYKGPRLAEGSTTLPEGASMEYWLVE